MKKSPIIIFFILSLGIIFSWFKDGLYFGGAEVGLSPIYNPARYLDIQQFIWWGDVAPGVLVPHFINAVPLYFVLSFIQDVFSPEVLQAILFFCLLFLMGFGMYLFVLPLMGKEKHYYATLAGLFYMFNSYTMVEVWHRFLYTGFFLAAALPVLAILWKKWLKGSFIYLTLFLLSNLVLSYMYGNLASLIAVWILCSMITISEVFLPWSGKKHFLNIDVKLVSGFLFFILTNLWWLIPTLAVSTSVLPQQHSSEGNISTLINISKQTVLPFTLQFANPFYLFDTKELGKIYTSFIFKLLPWLPAAVIMVGVVVSLRNKIFASFGLFYLMAIIIAKGAANPFGYPYIWGFMKTFFLGVIRNPFEKLGILMPFLGSLLFAIGLESLFLSSQKKYGGFISKFLVVVILGALLIYSFPMFTGDIFNKPTNSLKVKVPTSYELANEWLKKQESQEGNILHLPFSGRDVGTYKWQNGYHGVEINEILFTTLPSITRNTGIKTVDDTLSILTYILTPPYLRDQEEILRIFQNFNIKFIILHKDVDWQDKDTYGQKGLLLNPDELEKTLNNLSFLKKEQQFGDLVIYKLKDENYKPILFVSQDVQVIQPGKTDILQILSFKGKWKEMVTSPANVQEEFLNTQTMIIFPDKRINNLEASDSAMIAKINDSFKQVLEMRNYFSSRGYLQSSEIAEDLIYSTQEILNLYNNALQNGFPPTSSQAAKYELKMGSFLKKYSTELSIHTFEDYVSNQLKIHLFILKQLKLENMAKTIEEFMIKKELLPVYSNTNNVVFKFSVPQKDSYKLLSSPSVNEEDLKVNGNKIVSKDNMTLEQGRHEISLSSENDIALISNTPGKPLLGGQVLDIKKDSPVKYSGKIKIDGPTFIMFSQSYHPGWVLTLSRENTKLRVADQLIGNLYNNTWWVREGGVFDFNVEFTPQQYVTEGFILSVLSWVGILAIVGFVTLGKKFSQKI